MTLPTHRPRALAAVAAVGLSALLLAGCGASAEPTPTETIGTDAPTQAPTDAAPVPTAEPSDTAADLTCETLLSQDLLDELAAKGWTAKEAPFAAGGVTLDKGLQCTWADYAVPSGNLMIFGWAPITPDQAKAMQQGLGAKGWLRKTDSDTVYITEDPTQAPTTDENGYGMTYEFGDGWVTVADVKQSLLLIQRPAS